MSTQNQALSSTVGASPSRENSPSGSIPAGALWRYIAVVELLAAIVLVLMDVFIPTLVLLALLGISLLLRRESIASLGLSRPKHAGRMLAIVAGAVVVWSLLQLGLFMPVLNRVTGAVQDVSAFADLKGNLPLLLMLLGLTWTLAALGEEVVYRGYLQRRVRDVLGGSPVAVALGIILTSLLFGMAHTEQGAVGIVITTYDAVFFSLLKLKFGNNLWASILAHGVSNTLGLVTFFLAGPITGLW